ncbi:hypothetical protein HS7_16360 [Sulfolobales archaeon HS-7]|nr:hypothetical protein HS7_16360 [Sulfolobales archaeon HS-7]
MEYTGQIDVTTLLGDTNLIKFVQNTHDLINPNIILMKGGEHFVVLFIAPKVNIMMSSLITAFLLILEYLIITKMDFFRNRFFKSKKLNIHLNDRDLIILRVLLDGTDRFSEIVMRTGLPKSTVYRRLLRLIDQGVVEEQNDISGKKYKVKDEKIRKLVKGY